MPTQTAKLSEKLELLKLKTDVNELGTPESKWIHDGYVFASITNERGNTSFPIPGNVYTTTINFFMRYTPSITKKGTRIKYKGDEYRIVEIRNIARNQNTVIVVESVE